MAFTNQPLYEPLDKLDRLSPAKVEWCHGEILRTNGLIGIRIDIIFGAMAMLPQPTDPPYSISHGRARRLKFHDGEPEAINTAILASYPKFWDGYPRRSKDPMTAQQQHDAIGEIVKEFLMLGETGYGKELLRKTKKAAASSWDNVASL